MEREVTIKIPKTNKVIFGRLRGSVKKPLVLLVHGLHGKPEDHLYYNMARFLEQRGYASYRFGLYGSRKNQRTLHHTKLATYAQDINTIVQYFTRRGVKRFAAVGHSYGGPSIFLSDTTAFSAIIALDPSYNISFRKYRKAQWIDALHSYVITGADYFLIGKGMVEESETLDWKHLTSHITAPILFIMAGKGRLKRSVGTYMKEAQGPVKKIMVPYAGHTFSEDGAEEKIFSETLKWLQKYI